MKKFLIALMLCLVSICGFGQFYGPCHGNETVTDVEGNVYNTIQIGNTCWMKENLRSRLDTNYTVVGGYTYVSNYNDEDAVFYANSVSSIYYNIDNSLCPKGWKLPSSNDFVSLYYKMLNDGLINEYHFLEVLCDQSFIKDTLIGNNLSGFGLKPFIYYNSASYTPQYNNFYLWFMNDGILGKCSLNLSVGFNGLYMTTCLSGSSDLTWCNIRCIKDTSYTEVEQPTNDTIFIHDTITLVDTLYIYDTIYIHDTITITDTIYIHNGDAGIHEWGKNVKLYPNPASETITLENAEGCECFLYDINGAMIRKYHLSNSVEHLDIYDLSNGIYFIKIVNGGKFNMLKIIKG